MNFSTRVVWMTRTTLAAATVLMAGGVLAPAAFGQTNNGGVPTGAGHAGAPQQAPIITRGVRPPVVPNPNPPVIVLPVPSTPVIVIGPGGYYPYNPYYNPYWQRDTMVERLVVGTPQEQPAPTAGASTAPAAPAVPVVPPTARQRTIDALKLDGPGAVAAARSALNEHLAANPKDADAVRLLSLVLMREGKWRDAASTMALAYQTEPALAATALDTELVLAMARPRSDFLRFANVSRSASGWLTALVLLQADPTGPEKARANVLREFLKRAEQSGLEARVADEFRKQLAAPVKAAAPAAAPAAPAVAPVRAPAAGKPG